MGRTSRIRNKVWLTAVRGAGFPTLTGIHSEMGLIEVCFGVSWQKGVTTSMLADVPHHEIDLTIISHVKFSPEDSRALAGYTHNHLSQTLASCLTKCLEIHP